jgi:hypothetical protein
MSKSLRRRNWRIRRQQLQRLFRQQKLVIRVPGFDQLWSGYQAPDQYRGT